MVHWLSCSAECGIFLYQRSNLCLLHWQAASLPLSYQGSPYYNLFIYCIDIWIVSSFGALLFGLFPVLVLYCFAGNIHVQVFVWAYAFIFLCKYLGVEWLGEGDGTPLQYSCLENPMDGGAYWATVHGVAKSRTRLRNFTFTLHFHALEKEMATHSSVLAWRIPGMGEPGGLLSMGCTESHNWSDLAAAAAAGVEWLGYMIRLWLTFQEIAKLFSKMVVPFYSFTSSVWVLVPCQLFIWSILNFSHSSECVRASQVTRW